MTRAEKWSTLRWLSVEHDGRMPEFVRTCKSKDLPSLNISAFTHQMCTFGLIYPPKQRLAYLRRCKSLLRVNSLPVCRELSHHHPKIRPEPTRWGFTFSEDEEVRLFLSILTVEERLQQPSSPLFCAAVEWVHCFPVKTFSCICFPVFLMQIHVAADVKRFGPNVLHLNTKIFGLFVKYESLTAIFWPLYIPTLFAPVQFMEAFQMHAFLFPAFHKFSENRLYDEGDGTFSSSKCMFYDKHFSSSSFSVPPQLNLRRPAHFFGLPPSTAVCKFIIFCPLLSGMFSEVTIYFPLWSHPSHSPVASHLW